MQPAAPEPELPATVPPAATAGPRGPSVTSLAFQFSGEGQSDGCPTGPARICPSYPLSHTSKDRNAGIIIYLQNVFMKLRETSAELSFPQKVSFLMSQGHQRPLCH